VTATRQRLASIDVLRGVVMVLMALDHARDYFHDVNVIVEDTPDPGAALFLTRWVTHFCAPVFVFLAGTSVYLWRSRGRTQRETSFYLLSRGLWLIVLEWTAVHYGWFFEFTGLFLAQVIFAIGVAMIALSLLTLLPHRAVLAIGLAIVAGHNLLDRYDCQVETLADTFECNPWWLLLHQEGLVMVSQAHGLLLMAKYPLLPWIGVMAAGYGTGPVFLMDAPRRRRWLLGCGAAATVLFVLLRATSSYGDLVPWNRQANGGAAWITFLNCEKYPPSLQFLLMTLGPALLFLWAVDGGAGAWGRVMATYGRVPLFYYVAHIYLLHAASDVVYLLRLGAVPRPLSGVFPEGYGGPLWSAYVAWAAVVVVLYLPCRWYARVRKRSGSHLLTYL